MSPKNQLIAIFLCFTLSFFYIRSFLYGVKRYQLNNSAFKKRKKSESFFEWLLYKKYRLEIPKTLLILYFSVLIIHVVGFVICTFFYIFNLSQILGDTITRAIVCFDLLWILIIAFMFWSPGRDYAYSRWIKKHRHKNKK